ncbi:MAG: carbamoyltransferase HypF [Candidatus Omnitrophota bacterium]
MRTGAKIKLEGVVQGVGFRPFIHRLSKEFALAGGVLNTASGVEIEVEGEKRKIQDFYQRLSKELPPLAKITHRHINWTPAKGYKDFIIKDSKRTQTPSVLVSPDISICNDCLKELFTPADRRYFYPFINCVNCGPRFSIIENLPFDRAWTTMKKFKLCAACKSEFSDINQRRYHSQPNACAACGPDVELIKKSNKSLFKGSKAIIETKNLLKKGGIIAIKGLGGFHLSCDANNLSAIKELRKRKQRPFKPFALMAKDIKEAGKICEISNLEKRILTSPERPIVLLKKKINSGISETLAPHNNYLGVMLPYTALHYLLFSRQPTARKELTIMVMTSGNISDEPIETDNSQAVKNLNHICDYFLIHNRDIYNRLDDSIVQVINNKPVVGRRSRGYAPLPFFMHKKTKTILALGAELKNTFCLSKNKFTFLSQYIGDLKTYSTFAFYKQTIRRWTRLFAVKPKIIAYDYHPDYLSTQFAHALKSKDKNLRLFPVQHHQAHIASVIAEHQIEKKVIGICFDGAGLGLDGKIWGGEFFTGNLNNLRRNAHLEYLPLPGADKAIEQPYRMAISYLYQAFGEDIYKLGINFIKKHGTYNIGNIIKVIKTNALLTSSAGRLFDAVSALLGICDIITYEAQAAIELQMLAEKSNTKQRYVFDITEEAKNAPLVIKPKNVICQIVRDIKSGISREEIARKFHNGLAEISLRACDLLRRKTNISTVVLSGGVFQNKLFSETLIKLLKKAEFKICHNELVPPNDGAVSLGQLAIANARIAGQKTNL